MGAIAVALVGAVLLAVPGSPGYKKPTLGLDLQGGLEVIYRAVPDPGQKITPAGMQTAQLIMTNRANKTGVSAPNVAVQGGDEIVIQLAGVHDPAKAAKIIGTTGKLQFFDFENDLVPPTVSQGTPRPTGSLYTLLTAVKDQAKKGTPEAYYLFGTKTVTKQVTKTVKGKKVKTPQTTTTHTILQGPSPDRHQLLLPYKGGKQPADTQILTVPAHSLAVSCVLTSGNCIGAGSNGTSKDGRYWYLFKYKPRVVRPSGAIVNPNGPPELTGADLVESGISADIASDTNQPEVLLQFTHHGGQEFQRITRAEYRRGPFRAGLAGQTTNHDPSVV